MHYDVVLFDLPGTMGSDGVIATISALDYLFVPIKADRLVHVLEYGGPKGTYRFI